MQKILNVRVYVERKDLEKWCAYMLWSTGKLRINYKVFEEDMRLMLADHGLIGLREMDMDEVDEISKKRAENLVRKWYGEI